MPDLAVGTHSSLAEMQALMQAVFFDTSWLIACS